MPPLMTACGIDAALMDGLALAAGIVG